MVLKTLQPRTKIFQDTVGEGVIPPPPVQRKLRNAKPSRNPHLFNPQRDGNKTIQGVTYLEISEMLHVGMETETFLVVIELLKGGSSRVEITRRLEKVLPVQTRRGTLKNVSSRVSSVVFLLTSHGFVMKGSWRMSPPSAKD